MSVAPTIKEMRRPHLTSRHRQPERMDDPSLDPHLHHQALRGLCRINRISRTAAHLFPAIQFILGSHRSARILDVACGGGDVAIALGRIASQRGYQFDITAADLSPTALQFTQTSAQAHDLPIRVLTHDALAGHWPGGPYDILINSLMLHHLDTPAVITVLRNMRDEARLGFVVSDLLRTGIGWVAAQLAVHLLSRSPIVHHDGPRSVESAFTLDELHTLACQADLTSFTLQRIWPARALLTWRRP